MRKLGIVLSFLAALGLWPSVVMGQGTIVGPGNMILCPKVATIAVGTTGLTQVAAAITGASISLCGWHITNTASAGTFTISYGTGSNCGTGTTVIIPAQNVSNNAPATDHIDFAFFTTPVSQALCVNPSVATIAVVLYYNQF